MMSKDSVKRRFTGENGADGMSFTEFTYQLLQGYDFLYLNEHKNCKLQLGGADQWGNITTGTELIRKVTGNEAFALTCPLITKADGKKFGKTESGNVWLDPKRTSPYKFYQFWVNVTDEDAKRYIRIFTSLSREEIEALEKEQEEAPHLRVLQKRLAKELTIMVHSEQDYETAVAASNLLFSNGGAEELKAFDETTLLQIFESVPSFEVSREVFNEGRAVDILAEGMGVSKGEFRKLVQGGGISVNKQKLTAFDQQLTDADLLQSKYLVAQKGKKNYFLATVK
jgi:tyrosyl-tRNA synthetase